MEPLVLVAITLLALMLSRGQITLQFKAHFTASDSEQVAESQRPPNA